MNDNMIYSLDYIRTKLKGVDPASVWHGTGLSRHTVYRIRDGKADNFVRYDTVKALSDYFKRVE
tara:strand:+ start:290 stop:481 length:192 start_codon:yes stop_codon:yes gene_type:complete